MCWGRSNTVKWECPGENPAERGCGTACSREDEPTWYCKYSDTSENGFPDEVAERGDCEEGWTLNMNAYPKITYDECHDETPDGEWLCDRCHELRENRIENEDDQAEEVEIERDFEEEARWAEVEERRIEDAERWLGEKDVWFEQITNTLGPDAPLRPVRMGEAFPTVEEVREVYHHLRGQYTSIEDADGAWETYVEYGRPQR